MKGLTLSVSMSSHLGLVTGDRKKALTGSLSG